jgi:hypothetical protein
VYFFYGPCILEYHYFVLLVINDGVYSRDNFFRHILVSSHSLFILSFLNVLQPRCVLVLLVSRANSRWIICSFPCDEVRASESLYSPKLTIVLPFRCWIYKKAMVSCCVRKINSLYFSTTLNWVSTSSSHSSYFLDANQPFTTTTFDGSLYLS